MVMNLNVKHPLSYLFQDLPVTSWPYDGIPILF